MDESIIILDPTELWNAEVLVGRALTVQFYLLLPD